MLCVLALTGACGREQGASTSKVIDSAGVSIVTSTGSAWSERGVHVDSIPVLRIGAEEAGPYQFSFISTALLLEGGGIAVVELSAAEVRVRWSIFAPNGTWLGDLDAPPQRIVDCRDDLILGIWQEEGDAPYVQTHRLLRP